MLLHFFFDVRNSIEEKRQTTGGMSRKYYSSAQQIRASPFKTGYFVYMSNEMVPENLEITVSVGSFVSLLLLVSSYILCHCNPIASQVIGSLSTSPNILRRKRLFYFWQTSERVFNSSLIYTHYLKICIIQYLMWTKRIFVDHIYSCSEKMTLSETPLTSLEKLVLLSKWSKTSKTNVCIPCIRIKQTEI